MCIDPMRNLARIEGLLRDRTPAPEDLHRAYNLTLQLQSQLLSLIYDAEMFSGQAKGGPFAERQSGGDIVSGIVTLTIHEPLPAMKRLTEAIEEHWKGMLHSAIREAAARGTLPHFEKAFVEIEIATPRGSGNDKVWDTSNRAIQVILNNLKGIFFRDDDMEHMAFSVAGRWAEEGFTTIRVSDFDEYRQRAQVNPSGLVARAMTF